MVQPFLTRVFRSGTLASLATSLVAAVVGKLEEDEPLAPLNSVSHIVWGDEAAVQKDLTLKYTATGVALNTAAVTSWAGVHELLLGRTESSDPIRNLMCAGLVSGIAYITDYHVVPSRLTPGFEKRLSNRSLAAIYGALTLSLAVGSMLSRRRA